MMEQKIFRAPIELKADGQEGEFRAVFSTLNVKDWHEDVTLPGAFKAQEVVIEPWNHGYDLPVGKGVIRSDEKEAWIDGRFFTDTTGGRDHYLTVKNLGGTAEWSYTFDIEKSHRGEFQGQQVRFLSELDVFGVGPVTRGAGIGTQTVMIKEKGNGTDKDSDAKPDGEGEDGGDGDIAAIKPSDVGLTRFRIEALEIELLEDLNHGQSN